MRKESFSFLKAIQETPSPSGFEQPVQRISQGRRDIASQYAKNQVRLDAVTAETTKRAADGPVWRVVLRRLTKYP